MLVTMEDMVTEVKMEKNGEILENCDMINKIKSRLLELALRELKT